MQLSRFSPPRRASAYYVRMRLPGWLAGWLAESAGLRQGEVGCCFDLSAFLPSLDLPACLQWSLASRAKSGLPAFVF